MTARRTVTSLVAASFAALAFAVPASAQFAKPEDAIKYRQSAFALMGAHMGRLAAMAQGKVAYDAQAAVESARLVDTMAKLPWEGFVPETKGAKTGAKPHLYDNMDEVKQLVERLNAETGKLVDAAGSRALVADGCVTTSPGSRGARGGRRPSLRATYWIDVGCRSSARAICVMGTLPRCCRM